MTKIQEEVLNRTIKCAVEKISNVEINTMLAENEECIFNGALSETKEIILDGTESFFGAYIDNQLSVVDQQGNRLQVWDN